MARIMRRSLLDGAARPCPKVGAGAARRPGRRRSRGDDGVGGSAAPLAPLAAARILSVDGWAAGCRAPVAPGGRAGPGPGAGPAGPGRPAAGAGAGPGQPGGGPAGADRRRTGRRCCGRRRARLGENLHDTLAAPRLLVRPGFVGEEPCPGDGRASGGRRGGGAGGVGPGAAAAERAPGLLGTAGRWLAGELARRGIGPVAVVTGTVHNPAVDRLLQERRRAAGLLPLPRRRGSGASAAPPGPGRGGGGAAGPEPGRAQPAGALPGPAGADGGRVRPAGPAAGHPGAAAGHRAARGRATWCGTWRPCDRSRTRRRRGTTRRWPPSWPPATARWRNCCGGTRPSGSGSTTVGPNEHRRRERTDGRP